MSVTGETHAQMPAKRLISASFSRFVSFTSLPDASGEPWIENESG